MYFSKFSVRNSAAAFAASALVLLAGCSGNGPKIASSSITVSASAATANVGVPVNHFPTPSVGDGLLLVPSSNRVIAFHASAAN